MQTDQGVVIAEGSIPLPEIGHSGPLWIVENSGIGMSVVQYHTIKKIYYMHTHKNPRTVLALRCGAEGSRKLKPAHKKKISHTGHGQQKI